MFPSFSDLYLLGNTEHALTPSQEQISAVEKSYQKLRKSLDAGAQFYGIHTGFGANVTTKVTDSDGKKHQLDLLNYLSIGTGDFFPESVVRRALNLQMLKVGRGFSGVHPETFSRLAKLVRAPSLPPVPIYGSLGASGDLVPMAHAVAPLFANTQEFGPRDVLALVNTNAMMSSYAIELIFEVKKILDSSFPMTALNSLALGTSDESFSDKGLGVNQELFPHVLQAGQNIIKQRHKLKQKFLRGAPLLHSHVLDTTSSHASRAQHLGYDIPVQERYSIRCSPQILGNALSQIEFAQTKIMAEALAVSDNPLVMECSDPNGNKHGASTTVAPWHGGLFYTASLASSIDMLMDILGRVTELADRQLLLLMCPQTSHGLPENLGTPSELHLKGIHQLVSALQQQMRSLAMPSRLMSFSAESNNQDVLPCSMAALHNLKKSVEISCQILKASFFVGERACCYRFNLDIPGNLKLKEWSQYNIDKDFYGQA